VQDIVPPSTPAVIPPRPPHLVWRCVHAVEDALLGLALAGILLIPLLEMVMRTAFQGGVPGGNNLTQHLTLFVSTFGGALAARQSRLLTISQGFARAPAPWGPVFEILRAGFSAGIALMLAWSGWEFLQLELTSGRTVAFGIPVWVAQIPLAIGFTLIALRLIFHAGAHWGLRAAASAIAAALVIFMLQGEPASWTPAIVLLSILFVVTVLGGPIFALLGGAAVFLFWGSYNPLASVALSHYSLATNPTIPALPLFTLAGYFLAEGGTSQRMIRLLRALVGDMRAGPAIVTVAACAFFTSLTGASGVTILALGGLLVPFLVGARYNEKNAIGLLTGVGSIGLLFAPCLPLILYAIVAKVKIETMFLAGLLPGTLLMISCIAWAAWRRPAAAAEATPWRFDGREAFRAARSAGLELLIPVVSLGSIFSGLATPVEAAAMTALYALFIETVCYRDLKLSSLPHVARECGVLIGGVLLILGVAQALTNYLIDAQVPALLVDLVQTHVESRVMFILLLIIVLLIVGCLMDVFSAIIVVVPLIVPLGQLFGIDPVHLGILFLANLGLGFLTPPVGMNLFLSSLRFKRPMSEVLRASQPYFWLQFVVVIVISFWPELTLAVPRWFGF
jgi:C4-dicarboxylate transporter, DctM subunit